jgi:hypothetical protein
MADDAAESIGGGLRNWLGALGFISALIGAEVLREGGPRWFGVGLIVAGLPIYLSPAIWKRLSGLLRKQSVHILEYLHERDSSLGSAIIMMALRSAWGRWYSAQHLVNSESPLDKKHLLHIAGSVAMDKILDGELEVRGRRPGRLDYQVIPRTDWRSSTLYFVDDPRTIWRMVIVPRGGVEIAPDGVIARADDVACAARTSELANYDSLLIDSYQFEQLWPKNDRIADKQRRKFLRQARKLNLDPEEIKSLS